MTEGGSGKPEARGSSRPLGPFLAALVLAGLAALLIVQAIQIAGGAGFSVVGPGTIPLAVAIGLLGLSLIFVLRTTLLLDRGLAERADGEERHTHWPTVGIVSGLLVVYALALNGFRIGPVDVPGLGYIIATGLFLPLAARSLGSRHLRRDVLIGFGLALVIYFGFTRFLGVRLPAGLLDFIL